jgi:hypothetical protein
VHNTEVFYVNGLFSGPWPCIDFGTRTRRKTQNFTPQDASGTAWIFKSSMAEVLQLIVVLIMQVRKCGIRDALVGKACKCEVYSVDVLTLWDFQLSEIWCWYRARRKLRIFWKLLWVLAFIIPIFVSCHDCVEHEKRTMMHYSYAKNGWDCFVHTWHHVWSISLHSWLGTAIICLQ